MAYLTGKTKGGKDWTPTFIEAIDHEKCIGCGRCYKVCSRSVLGPLDLEDEETGSTRMVRFPPQKADAFPPRSSRGRFYLPSLPSPRGWVPMFSTGPSPATRAGDTVMPCASSPTTRKWPPATTSAWSAGDKSAS